MLNHNRTQLRFVDMAASAEVQQNGCLKMAAIAVPNVLTSPHLGHKMSQVLLRKGKNGPVIEKKCEKTTPTLHCKPPVTCLQQTFPRNLTSTQWKFP